MKGCREHCPHCGAVLDRTPLFKHLNKCPRRPKLKIKATRRVVTMCIEARLACGCHVRRWFGDIPDGHVHAETVHACEAWKDHKYDLTAQEQKMSPYGNKVIRYAKGQTRI